MIMHGESGNMENGNLDHQLYILLNNVAFNVESY